jgi:hypothetical protein
MKRVFTSFIFCLLIIFGCSPVKILKTDKAEGFSLSKYKTFDFVPVTFDGIESPTYNTRIQWIKEEVAKQLARRGLQQTATDPDLLVNIGIVIAEVTQTRETTVRDAPMYMGQRNYTWQSQDIPVGTYNEGTVTVELVDRVKNDMVWEGVASSVVEKKNEASHKNITDGMEKLFTEINQP